MATVTINPNSQAQLAAYSANADQAQIKSEERPERRQTLKQTGPAGHHYRIHLQDK